jgi:hypothetical protein
MSDKEVISSTGSLPNGSPKDTKFKKGNKFGKGNPHGKKVNDFRTAFMQAITPEDVKAMLCVLKKQALDGNLDALKYALDRALGKATQNLNVDATGTMKTYLSINIEEV